MTSVSNAPLQVGEIVYLVSGSPKMTVVAVDELITCVWFPWQESHLQTAEFPSSALVRRLSSYIVPSQTTQRDPWDTSEPYGTDSKFSVFDPPNNQTPSIGEVFRSKATDPSNFGKADPSQQTPF